MGHHPTVDKLPFSGLHEALGFEELADGALSQTRDLRSLLVPRSQGGPGLPTPREEEGGGPSQATKQRCDRWRKLVGGSRCRERDPK
eukprot:2112739-Pyramimonas_sp.AAC.1